MERFSDNLEAYDGELSGDLKTTLLQLAELVEEKSLKILKWSENYIAVPIEIQVELPARGPIDLEILKREPVMLLFNREQYPYVAPKAKTDRQDFPKSQASHLYASKKGQAATFCLMRGDINNWYCYNSISDFIGLVQNWFWKAANGTLLEDNSQFDPTRLEGYTGFFSYPYESIFKIVKSKSKITGKDAFAVLMHSFVKKKESDNDSTSYKYLTEIHKNLNQALDLAKAVNEALKEKKEFEKLLFGLLVWQKGKKSYREYTVDLPDNYRELKEFGSRYGIDISAAIKYYLESGLDLFNGIPIIVAVKRPSNLIGYAGNIEFFHFTILADSAKTKGNEIDDNADVFLKSHREVLTPNKAQEISGYKNDLGKILFLGAGSLGSKMIMHLAKNGHVDQLIVDTDKVEPHNLVRHVLNEKSIGESKSESMKNAIIGLYGGESNLNSKVLSGDRDATKLVLEEPESIFKSLNWMIDTTASDLVLNSISNARLKGINICRAEMAYGGRLGILYVEGKDRSPRLDDLSFYIYAKANKLPLIKEWLNAELEVRQGMGRQTLIEVGVGCNSESLIMSDDYISNHAAAFTSSLKNLAQRNSINDRGLIFINQIEENEGLVNISSRNLIIEPVITLNALNDSDWEIRLQHDVKMTLEKQFGSSFPNETGGILIGVVNLKRKIIYVLDIILAPPDSKANPACFIRGIKNLPESVERIKDDSGELIGYVGEWHTHPHGPNELSDIDLNTIQDLIPLNKAIRIPTFVMIVAPDGILPYVFN